MKNGKPFPIPVRAHYSCAKCPAYCCTYEDIPITTFDLERLARHFNLDAAQAEERFTKRDAKTKALLLRHKRDTHFTTACMFLDQKTRRCTVYEARPGVCRKFPESSRCGYYEFLKFEREQQGDPEYIALTS